MAVTTTGETTMATRRTRVLLNLTEASDYLHRHPSYLRRLVDKRKIKFYKLGGRVLFDQHDLDDHLDAAAVEPLPW